MYKGVRKNFDFRPTSRFLAINTWLLLQWKTNKNSYAICRMVPFSMTSSDPDLNFKNITFS